ncbi:hypothetical protein Tco_1187129, partial [Tanacetum coccineum]
QVGNTTGDVFERDLLPLVPRPYYIPYPYDEGSELYKDPKVCRTSLDRFLTPAETQQLKELSSVELSDQNADIMEQNESVVRANEEVSRNERDALAIEKAKIEEELVETKFLKSGEFNWAFTGVLNTAISVGVECGLCMDRIDEEFKELSQRVDGFIPNAQEKFDGAVATFSQTNFPFLNRL